MNRGTLIERSDQFKRNTNEFAPKVEKLNPKIETATFVFLTRKVLVAIHDQCEAKREAAE
jgi:hypothetical protein